MKKIALTITLATAFALPVYAQQQSTDHSAHRPAEVNKSNAAMADGEVRRIDKDAKKLTIRHGPIVNLDMPPMTMVFQVKDEALLDKVRIGAKVKFSAEKITGGYTVTSIETVSP